jgi:hypothetical protein
MRFDDGVIAASLDDTWRTVPAVKRLLRNSCPPEEDSEALRDWRAPARSKSKNRIPPFQGTGTWRSE